MATSKLNFESLFDFIKFFKYLKHSIQNTVVEKSARFYFPFFIALGEAQSYVILWINFRRTYGTIAAGMKCQKGLIEIILRGLLQFY
jgi:hypothetical protein